MSVNAYALLSLFLILSVVIGVVAARLIGPGGWRPAILPVLGVFGAFYLVGHKLGIAFGPTVMLFTFEVAIVSDLLIGIVVAVAVALAQRGLLRRRGI